MSHHAEHKTYSFVLTGMSHSGLMYNAVFDFFFFFFPSVTMSYEVCRETGQIFCWKSHIGEVVNSFGKMNLDVTSLENFRSGEPKRALDGAPGAAV